MGQYGRPPLATAGLLVSKLSIGHEGPRRVRLSVTQSPCQISLKSAKQLRETAFNIYQNDGHPPSHLLSAF